MKELLARMKPRYAWIGSIAAAIILIFNAWFLHFGIRTDGDWGYFLKETSDTLRRHYFTIWLSDSSFGRVLIDAGQALSYAAYGWLSYYFGLDYTITERLVHLWPAVVVAFASSFYLVYSLTKDKWAALLGMLVYSANTYYLTLLTGHLTLAVAYAIAPLVVLFYIKTIQTGRLFYGILSAFALTACSAYEPRSAYIIVMMLALLALFHFIFIFLTREDKDIRMWLRMGIVYTTPVLLFGLLNLYWLLGLATSGGTAGAGVIESSLFGNEYFDILKALTLFHPFWSGGEIVPFINQAIPVYFWIIPLAAFAGFMLNRRNYMMFFFVTLAIVGVLLTKQSGEPFTSLYLWLFQHIPGFNAYREASKFYLLVAIAYSVLIPLVYIALKRRFPKRVYVTGYAVLCLLFLPNLIPVATNQIGSTFLEREIPQQYVELNAFLNKDEYSRVMWVPQKSRWSLVTAAHPSVNASKAAFDAWQDFQVTYDEVNNATPTDEITALLHKKFTATLLANGSIRYLVVPLRDLQNDDDFYRSYNDDPSIFVDALRAQGYLKEVTQKFKDVAVFELRQAPKPYLSAATNLYGLDSLQDLDGAYDLWQQNLKHGEFDFITQQSGKTYDYVTDIHDVLGDFKTYGRSGEVQPSFTNDNKEKQYFVDPDFSRLSYSANDEAVTLRRGYDALAAGGRADVEELPVSLQPQNKYLLAIDEQVVNINKDGKTRDLGSPQSESVVYKVTPQNLIPEGEEARGLWTTKVEDCNDYGTKARIALHDEYDIKINRPVIALRARNHIACTGPPALKVAPGNYLLRFNYRVRDGQFAGYRLMYNDAKGTRQTKNLAVGDEMWRQYETIISVPEGASQLKVQLLGRPSNQAAKKATTLYDSLELFSLEKQAAMQAESAQKTPLEKSAITPYKNAAFDGRNLLKNGDFSQGLWKKKVSDCNAYDKQPELGMDLRDEVEGKQKVLELRAKRHIACTSPGRIEVEGGNSYLLQFDYQTPSASRAGYMVEMQGRKPVRISGSIPTKDKQWHSFQKVITIPTEVKSLNISVFAYGSDDSESKTNVNRYDNIVFKKVPNLQGRVYEVGKSRVGMAAPSQLKMLESSNTRKDIEITARQPFILRMSEQFHPGWAMIASSPATHGAYEWNPFANSQKITSADHLEMNAFQNGWYVDPAKICQQPGVDCRAGQDGDYTVRLSVVFLPQRWFNFGLAISLATVTLCLITLIIGYKKRKQLKAAVQARRRK